MAHISRTITTVRSVFRSASFAKIFHPSETLAMKHRLCGPKMTKYAAGFYLVDHSV